MIFTIFFFLLISQLLNYFPGVPNATFLIPATNLKLAICMAFLGSHACLRFQPSTICIDLYTPRCQIPSVMQH